MAVVAVVVLGALLARGRAVAELGAHPAGTRALPLVVPRFFAMFIIVSIIAISSTCLQWSRCIRPLILRSVGAGLMTHDA